VNKLSKKNFESLTCSGQEGRDNTLIQGEIVAHGLKDGVYQSSKVIVMQMGKTSKYDACPKCNKKVLDMKMAFKSFDARLRFREEYFKEEAKIKCQVQRMTPLNWDSYGTSLVKLCRDMSQVLYS